MSLLPISSLNQFASLPNGDPNAARAALRASTGQEAPPCAERQIKLFVCPAGTYTYIDSAGNPQPLVIGADIAGVVNLPGVPQYPARKIAASGFVLKGPNSTTPMSPTLLSTKAEADALVAELGYGAAVENLGGNGWSFVYPATETRRVWLIGLSDGSGLTATVGQLLGGILPDGSSAPAGRCSLGVGYPGTWDTSDQQSPKWTPAVLLSEPTDPKNQIPMSVPVTWPLPANETIVMIEPIPGAPAIPMVQVGAGPAPPAAGGFTDRDRMMLTFVYRSNGGA